MHQLKKKQALKPCSKSQASSSSTAAVSCVSWFPLTIQQLPNCFNKHVSSSLTQTDKAFPGALSVIPLSCLIPGTEAWPPGVCLKYVGGDQFGHVNMVMVRSLEPQEMADVSVQMCSPSTAGMYQGQWRMCTATGLYYGGEQPAGDSRDTTGPKWSGKA